MSYQTIRRTVFCTGLLPVLMGIFFLGTLFSQSLGNVARQERARKAQEGKSAKVYTNADIPGAAPEAPPTPAPAPSAQAEKQQAAEEKPAVGEQAEGKPAEGETGEAKPAGGAKTAAPAAKEEAKTPEQTRAELEKEYRGKFAKLRDSQATEEKKLDVMQRELNLMQIQYSSDPNVTLQQEYSRGNINQRTQEMEQQKAAVGKAKQAIADLEEELRKKNLPPGWAR